MRRRAKRDLSVIAGAIVILAGVIFFNGQVNRSAMASEYDKWRRDVERQRMEEGLDLLSWDLLRKTRGSLRGGGRFAEDLFLYNEQPVHLMGYMVPHEQQFRDVTEFLFLPLPIECYFCGIPPERDVMLVRLREGQTAQIYEEPVLVNGILKVHEGPGVKYFYSITEAGIGPGETGGKLHRRQIAPEHMIPDHAPREEDLLPPVRLDSD